MALNSKTKATLTRTTVIYQLRAVCLIEGAAVARTLPHYTAFNRSQGAAFSVCKTAFQRAAFSVVEQRIRDPPRILLKRDDMNSVFTRRLENRPAMGK